MATPTKKKINSYFNEISNPAGGLSSLFGAPKPTASASYLSSVAPKGGMSSLFPTTTVKTAAPSRSEALGGRAPVAPVAPSRAEALGGRAPVAPPGYSGAPVSRGTAPITPTSAAPEASQVPPQWLNADGSIKTPEQIAMDIGNTLKNSQGNGDIGTLAGNEFGGAEKTAEQLRAEASQINNIRNDIASGENDPYKVASKSGIAYTPAELRAIESAYAGIYDPAITTALAKVEQKQIEDEAARKSAEALASDERQNAFELTKMEKQFGYDQRLKQTPTPGSGSSSGLSGTYVPGENPVVDAWAQRIFDGAAKLTDIPVSDKGLRSAVVAALESSGNDFMGRPTATELGLKSKEAALNLLAKMDNKEGTAAVGGSRVFGGALGLPGSDPRNFTIDFQNLKDLLSLDGTRYLKGQGQVSDAERAMLASAVTRLNLAQSEGDFRTTLNDIVSTLDGSKYGSTEDVSSGQPPTMILNGQTFYLQADGTYQ